MIKSNVESELAELKSFYQIIDLATNALNEGAPVDLEQLFQGKLASAMLALMFAGEFIRHGGKNFLELEYNLSSFGRFTVTVQKVEGVTPCARIAELEDAIRTHSNSVHFCEVCGKDDPCSTDDVCTVINHD